MRHPLTATLVTAFLLAACVGSGETLTTAAPQPLPIVELKYRVFDHIGRPWYCDPDFYPIQREDETVLAEQRLPEIRRDSETYLAILSHNGMPAGSPLTARERLAVYRAWKQLNAFALEPDGSGYAFTIPIEPQDTASPRGEIVSGTIDVHGVLRVTKRSAADPPMCPICLAEASLIDTPAGPIRVSELRVGMAVWTQSADGARVAAPILAVAKVEAPVGHEVLRITLADGRTVT
ncbi:MAG: hypothetical protein ACRDGB_16040, partial [Candidatus Limnocylindria bacterium]